MKRGKRRLWRTLLIIIVLLALARFFVFHTVRIEGTSMEDTLKNGQFTLVTQLDNWLEYTPRRGDIMECRFPGRSGTYVKRVIGLPGEKVELLDGQTFIDGTMLEEDYVSSPGEDYTITLGEDQYFVLGDNRRDSYDSRTEDMGVLSKSDFIGRVRLTLFPFYIM